MKPEISVIVVAYNEKEYIAETLESIMAQKTNFKFEILCHDDASTDGTQDVILEYQRRFPDIVVPILQKENKMQNGHQIVVEYCYPKARGRYIAYCDGDDYWVNDNKLQKQYDFMESNKDYVMCLHNFDFLDVESGRFSSSGCGTKDRDMQVEEFILWDSMKVPQIGTSIFRADLAKERPELFIKIGGGSNSLRPISDQPLYIYLALHGKVKYFADVMSIWRRRGVESWGGTKEKNKHVQFNLDKISFLKELDRFTSYKYKLPIQKAIERCKFTIAWTIRDFKQAKRYAKSMDKSIVFLILINIMSIVPNISKHLLEYKGNKLKGTK